MRGKLMGLVLAAMISVLPALAQNDLVLPLPDGGTLTYSGDWVITSDNGEFEDGKLTMESDEQALLLWIYFAEATTLADNEVSTLAEFVEYDYGFYDASQEQPFDADAVIFSQEDGVEIAEYTFQNPDPDFPYDITVLYRLTPDGAGISLEATSYAEIEVGDISGVVDIINNYVPADETQGISEIMCEIVVPTGLVLREDTSPTSRAVRTIRDVDGERTTAVSIRLDDNDAPWYFLDAENAYVRVIVIREASEDCDSLPRTRR